MTQSTESINETHRDPDPTGRATMSSSISEAENYHRYLLNTLKPYLGKRIWEVGSGFGQYTDMLLDDGYTVLATDIDTELLEQLDAKKNQHEGRLATQFVDLYDPASIAECGKWGPDSVLSLNVLEHIEKDFEAVEALYKSVPAGTNIVFLMPAFESLYGFMDDEAGHYRRYTRGTTHKKFADAGWTIEKTFYVNSIGAAGWFVRNKIMPPKERHLDSKEVNDNIKFFDKYCVGPTAVLDRVLGPIFGQSVVVVGKKSS